MGTRISILFDADSNHEQWYAGTIVAFDRIDMLYKVQFDDGDKGKFTDLELIQDALAGVLQILERAV